MTEAWQALGARFAASGLPMVPVPEAAFAVAERLLAPQSGDV